MAHPIPPAGAVPPGVFPAAGAPPVIPVPMAAGDPPPAVALPPTPPPRTYRELYGTESSNPPLDRTARYLAGYRFAADPEGGAIPTPMALRDQTITLSDRQPMAFLALVNGPDGNYEVVILHRLVRYLDLPGDDPSGFNDRVMGLVGDIMPHQYPTAEVPGTAFHLVGMAVRVPTVAAMAAWVPAWNEADTPTLGPFAEDAAETEVVRPRYTQVVPGRIAALLVHRRQVHPKRAYQEIVGDLLARGQMEACRDIVIWLRAACTARGGGGAQAAVPCVLQALTALHLPPDVYRYVTNKIRSDLPATIEPSRLGAVGADAVADAIRALGDARGAGGGGAGDGARTPREPKSIADTYKETFQTLLRFCNVAEVTGVAPLWPRLANATKGEQHVVITQELQRVCMSRGLSTEVFVPVITTTLKQMVIGFQFCGHGADDLSSGCQPFMVAYAGSNNHYAALASATVGNQLSQGEQNASLADYRTIRDSERIKFPRDIFEVAITLTRFAVLCQCLFQGVGPPHPFVESMWALSVAFQNSTPFIAERYNQLSRTPGLGTTYPARILRAIQLSVFEYLQQVAISVGAGVGGIDLPSFATLVQDLKRGTFHLSTNWIGIPEAYLDPVAVPGGANSRIPSVAGTSASSITSGRTSVSALTTETGTVAPVSRIANPTVDAELSSILLRPGGARAVMRTHRPPLNDAGHEFCVAWWTRSACFPNCGRRITHVPFASPAERGRLLAYVHEHLQAPASGSA